VKDVNTTGLPSLPLSPFNNKTVTMVFLATVAQHNFSHKINLSSRPVGLGLNNCKMNFMSNRSIQDIMQQATDYKFNLSSRKCCYTIPVQEVTNVVKVTADTQMPNKLNQTSFSP
jgi:hypothetical protein